MSERPSLAGRATLAVALMIGFYALALGLAGVLLWLPYYEFVVAKTVHAKLVACCVVAAIAILWAVCPRVDRFTAPGPLADRAEQPELFAAIEEVASATGQAMPSEVYLVNDVNAWVAERGGVMGFGSRRVMGIGVPLMQLLTVSEFKGVLAHEFGHYHGGDTKLGPWIYKTRSAIVRSVENLGTSLLQKPFVWYGNMFLRMTHGMSRAQEYAADALAAGVVGKPAMVSGLRTIHGAAPAFEAYWQAEAAPVLGAGLRPPLASGFAQFLAAPAVKEALAKQLEHASSRLHADPYDTHPSLLERTRAIEQLSGLPRPLAQDDRPAIALLRGLPRIEFALLASAAGDAQARELREVEWSEAAERVYAPYWRTRCAEQAEILRGVRVADLPQHAAARGQALRTAQGPIVGEGGGEDGGEAGAAQLEAEEALDALGAALATALMDRGHRLERAPGHPVSFRNRDASAACATLAPFEAMHALARGTLGVQEWHERCVAFGLEEIILG